jgi:hypothetical protein
MMKWDPGAFQQSNSSHPCKYPVHPLTKDHELEVTSQNRIHVLKHSNQWTENKPGIPIYASATAYSNSWMLLNFSFWLTSRPSQVDSRWCFIQSTLRGCISAKQGPIWSNAKQAMSRFSVLLFSCICFLYFPFISLTYQFLWILRLDWHMQDNIFKFLFVQLRI